MMWLLPFGSPIFYAQMSLLQNTHLGEEERESREQEQKRLKNEERLTIEKICKVSLPCAPFHLYSIRTLPSIRLLLLTVTE